MAKKSGDILGSGELVYDKTQIEREIGAPMSELHFVLRDDAVWPLLGEDTRNAVNDTDHRPE